MRERWKTIVGWDRFEVSDLGRVRRKSDHYPMSLVTTRKGGYVVVQLSRPTKQRKVHQLVLEAFVGPRPEGTVACHNNGDPADNRLPNLRWGTASANQKDAVAHGTHAGVKKTRCPRGHDYTASNTYTHRARRQCLTCRNERNKVSNAQRKEDAQRCKEGHPYDRVSKNGRRFCSICKSVQLKKMVEARW